MPIKTILNSSVFFLLVAVIFACKKNNNEPEDIPEDLITDVAVSEELSFGNNCNSYLRSYKGAILNSFSITSDGGYMFCGKGFSSEGKTHTYVLKTDCFGEKEWENRFKSEYNSEATFVSQIGTNDYIFYSREYLAENSTEYTCHLTRSNKSGEIIWKRKHDDKTTIEFRNICDLGDQSGIVALTTDRHPSYNAEAILKTDFSGAEIFRRRLMGEGRYHYLAETSDGSFLASGELSNNPIVMKLNSQGDSIWTKTLVVDGESAAFYINELSNGDIVLAGISKNTQFNVDRTVFISRLTSSGIPLWNFQYSAEEFLNFDDAAISTDGNLLTSVTKADTSAVLTKLLKINLSDGAIIWERNSGTLLGNSLLGTADNSMIYIGSDNIKRETLIRKTDVEGF
ncbi:MAG: hypothetical protein AB8B72_12345 [Crocinitomicaceae bacterium]